jgi:hypothetical protein
MRTVTDSVYGNTPIGNSQPYSPSVPLSIYRDLAAELQACQAKINEFAIQNQQLVQENQTLRQEIAKTVQSVLHLQQLVDYQGTTSYKQTFNPYPDFQSEPKRPPTVEQHFSRAQTPRSAVVTPVEEISSSMSETFFIEEEEVNYYPPSDPDTSEVSGWKLVITILLIVLMGFGAGYLIVRPLFEHHDR